MPFNSLKVFRIASEINTLTNDELSTLCDCVNEPVADKMINYLSFILQDRKTNIEVQEPVC